VAVHPLEPGYLLLLGEFGGKILYHPAGSKIPQKYHLFLLFEDGSFLTALTQMWGAMDFTNKDRKPKDSMSKE
jgi:hypothetical protein